MTIRKQHDAVAQGWCDLMGLFGEHDAEGPVAP